ncbi:hypothetical protein [uncultured Sphingomonas sp.]|uniref:hypothetical protein n=1 Tax=uncultured Sphingomonas sp. TaxID=158754 RepID=UPI0025D526CA|nr:hypothetical protein [uncultured Sphingomonas sp.]
MAVKFLQPCQQGTLYNEGEVAVFDDETEARLVKQQFAEKVKAAPKTEKPAE